MPETLAERFIENLGQPVELNGKTICMSFQIPVQKDQEISIEIVSSHGEVRQGIEISLDKGKGLIRVNEMDLHAPVFWTDTAPKHITFQCLTVKKNGVLNIWNVWQFADEEDHEEDDVDYSELVEAWTGNSGIYVEQLEEGVYQLHCSNGIGDPDFSNFIFKVSC